MTRVAALAVSFALPLRLSFTKSKRFAGGTPSAQIRLGLDAYGRRNGSRHHSAGEAGAVTNRVNYGNV